MNRNLTPFRIVCGQRLICRFAAGALLLRQYRWYVVSLVFPSVTAGRMLEFEELPGLFYPAWRFMAYEPSRLDYRHAEPVEADALTAAIAEQGPLPWRRSDDTHSEAELACPVAR